MAGGTGLGGLTMQDRVVRAAKLDLNARPAMRMAFRAFVAIYLNAAGSNSSWTSSSEKTSRDLVAIRLPQLR